MKAYYARRAAEYEHIYARPERQQELGVLHSTIERAFAGRRIIDIACGTGFFTATAARGARSVNGIDVNEETLAIARAKGISNADFSVADAYALPSAGEPYEGALVTFWLSHVPRARIEEFLRGVQAVLAKDAPVVIVDNAYVEGNSTPIARRDAAGDTYQSRTLENGERYEVLKNFPSDAELAAWGERFGTEVEVRFLDYYWLLGYLSQPRG